MMKVEQFMEFGLEMSASSSMEEFLGFFVGYDVLMLFYDTNVIHVVFIWFDYDCVTSIGIDSMFEDM